MVVTDRNVHSISTFSFGNQLEDPLLRLDPPFDANTMLLSQHPALSSVMHGMISWEERIKPGWSVAQSGQAWDIVVRTFAYLQQSSSPPPKVERETVVDYWRPYFRRRGGVVPLDEAFASRRWVNELHNLEARLKQQEDPFLTFLHEQRVSHNLPFYTTRKLVLSMKRLGELQAAR